MNDQNTYLITWNPSKWKWDNLTEKIEEITKTGKTQEMWIFASHKKVKIGDRIFLVKLGKQTKPPKGIIASGHVASIPFLAPHWDPNKKDTHRVIVEFDTIIDYDTQNILCLDYLKKDISNTFPWTNQNCGIEISKEIVNKLEESWFNISKKNIKLTIDTLKSNNKYKALQEGAFKTIITRRYERNPHARKKCLDYYKYSCSVCKLSFENYYGDIGKDFIHVHHLTPISDIGIEYEIDPIKDLRPVCPNCHAMLHRKSPPYSIEELINKIKKT